jgi:hypothetical protein
MSRPVIFSSSQGCNVQPHSGAQPVAIGIYFFGGKRGKPNNLHRTAWSLMSKSISSLKQINCVHRGWQYQIILLYLQHVSAQLVYNQEYPQKMTSGINKFHKYGDVK